MKYNTKSRVSGEPPKIEVMGLNPPQF